MFPQNPVEVMQKLTFHENCTCEMISFYIDEEILKIKIIM